MTEELVWFAVGMAGGGVTVVIIAVFALKRWARRSWL